MILPGFSQTGALWTASSGGVSSFSKTLPTSFVGVVGEPSSLEGTMVSRGAVWNAEAIEAGHAVRMSAGLVALYPLAEN